MKPSTSPKQGSATSAENENFSLSEAETTDAAAESSLDPLDQITDVFRDLDEFQIRKSDRGSLRETMKLTEVLTPSKAIAGEPDGFRVGSAPAHQAPHVWWRRLVSPPELIFSIGFSLFIVFVTALIRSP